MSSYSLWLLGAILIGWCIWTHEALTRKWLNSPARSPSILFVLAGICGARLLAVAGEWDRYNHHLFSPSGPLAIQGAMLGFLGAAAAYARWRRISILEVMDASCLALAAMIIPIRSGCLAAGCCFGTTTSMPWAVCGPHGDAVHPTQAYEILLGVGLSVVLVWLRRSMSAPGCRLSAFLCIYGLGRSGIELFRDDTIPIVAGITYPQVTGAAMFIAGAVLWTMRDRSAAVQRIGTA
jgi:phosphatidylglycerol:prolipoprotein diacylglycerol transferase